MKYRLENLRSVIWVKSLGLNEIWKFDWRNIVKKKTFDHFTSLLKIWLFANVTFYFHFPYAFLLETWTMFNSNCRFVWEQKFKISHENDFSKWWREEHFGSWYRLDFKPNSSSVVSVAKKKHQRQWTNEENEKTKHRMTLEERKVLSSRVARCVLSGGVSITDDNSSIRLFIFARSQLDSWWYHTE